MTLKYKDLTIELHPEVYEPAEDTFLLAEHLDVRDGDRVLELGVGTGLLSLIASRGAAHVFGVDINPYAVDLACRNAVENNIHNVHFEPSNLFSDVYGKYNLIIFNPPYVPVSEEGNLAKSWSGGEGGVEVIHKFISNVRNYLLPDGRFITLASSINDLKFLRKEFHDLGLPFIIQAQGKVPFETLYVISSKV